MSTPHPRTQQALSISGLERVYDHMAQALDQVGADKSTLFLAKLALLCANLMGDEELFCAQVDAAMKDLQA
jgi:hypothetical protein